jgi:hypothetical protein
VVFLSDGGDSVRNLQAYLHPDSEHWLDWFHITMRIADFSLFGVLIILSRVWPVGSPGNPHE